MQRKQSFAELVQQGRDRGIPSIDVIRDAIVDEALVKLGALEKEMATRPVPPAKDRTFIPDPSLFKLVTADYVSRRINEKLVIDPKQFDLADHKERTANKRNFLGEIARALQATPEEAAAFLNTVDAIITRGIAPYDFTKQPQGLSQI